MKGIFLNTVKVEWIRGERRRMRLLEDFVYIDSSGLEWRAKTGDIIDGASIPRFFWRVIGSPFIGLYREPSVIHDVYCQNKSRSAQATHDCFLEMMLINGVSNKKSDTMYNAVNTFGPRW